MAKQKRIHEELKHWLVELGKESGYGKSYSGDCQPIDIRIRKKHIEYSPDVIWNHKGRLYIMEIAFSEDWRAIVGEFLLVSMISNCKGFFIITVGDSDFTNNLFTLIGRKLGYPNWISYTFEPEDLKDSENMKKEMKKWLKQNDWI